MREPFTDVEITEMVNEAFGQCVARARVNNEKDGVFCRKVEGMLELKDTIDFILNCKIGKKRRERERLIKEVNNRKC